MNKKLLLRELRSPVQTCELCNLCETRFFLFCTSDPTGLNKLSVSFSSRSYLCIHPFLFPPQSFYSDSYSPDVYFGSDVGVRSLPVSEGRHCCRIYLHHPQQPAGSSGLCHALPPV